MNTTAGVLLYRYWKTCLCNTQPCTCISDIRRLKPTRSAFSRNNFCCNLNTVGQWNHILSVNVEYGVITSWSKRDDCSKFDQVVLHDQEVSVLCGNGRFCLSVNISLLVLRTRSLGTLVSKLSNKRQIPHLGISVNGSLCKRDFYSKANCAWAHCLTDVDAVISDD